MNKFVTLMVVIAPACFPADTQPAEPGRKAEVTYCVSCHSIRLIDSQRLSSAAWTKEMDKMIGWGAIVPVPDKQILLDYLATEYSNAKPAPPPVTSGNGVKD